MEEIMYRLYVLENIRRGQQDAEQGKITPVDEVLREIDSWWNGVAMHLHKCEASIRVIYEIIDTEVIVLSVIHKIRDLQASDIPRT